MRSLRLPHYLLLRILPTMRLIAVPLLAEWEQQQGMGVLERRVCRVRAQQRIATHTPPLHVLVRYDIIEGEYECVCECV